MSLGRRSVVNLAGAALPLLVSLPAVGALARVLDAESFSLVLLAWALVGFAGILDLGLSRAVVRQVALERDHGQALDNTLRSAGSAAALLGLLGAGLIVLLREPLLAALGVSAALHDDAARGLLWTALSVPLLLPALVLQSHWDGAEDFVEANLQRALSGSLVPLLTLAGALWQPRFSTAMIGLVAARALALLLAVTRRGMASRLRSGRVQRRHLVELIRFGGWVTVSNTVSPIMNTLDRYLLGFVRGAAVVGFYAAPSDAANKLLVLPVAVTRGLFPALARDPDPLQRATLLRDAYRLVALYSVPIAVAGALLAEPVLGLWLGPAFAARSTPALQVLMLSLIHI